jgi:hypothetical protein
MSERRDETIAYAIQQGMDPEEAEHLVDTKDDSLIVGVQLPPYAAPEIMVELAKIGMLTGPVRFYICVAGDRKDLMTEIMSDGDKDKVVQEWDYSTADEGVDAAVARIRKGFVGGGDIELPEGSEAD